MDKDEQLYKAYQDFLDEEVEDLSDKFQELEVSPVDSNSHSDVDELRMVITRSGRSYPSDTMAEVPHKMDVRPGTQTPAPLSSNSGGDDNNTLGQSSQVITPSLPSSALRVITTTVNVKPFSGEDPAHSVRSYIRECEDAMRTHNLTTGSEKIAFLRQYLQSGSLAAQTVLDSNYFDTPNYEEFVVALKNTFGRASASNYLGKINDWVDYLHAHGGTQNTIEAQNGASRITNQAVSVLLDQQWITPDEKGNITKFLEVYHYMMLLGERYRNVSKTVSFEPRERMWDLHPRIMNKLEVDHAGPQLIIGKVGAPAAEPTSYAAAATTPSGVTPRDTATKSKRCTFCQLLGHTASHCFKRRKTKKKANVGGTPGAAAPTARPTPTSTTPTQQRTSVQAPPAPQIQLVSRPERYCKIHNTTSHSLDECYSVNRLSDRLRTARASGTAGTWCHGTAPAGSPDAPNRAVSRETQHQPQHYPR